MTLHEPALAHVRVRDAMHAGILTTDPSTPLREVARLMAEHHVHAIAVSGPEYSREPWGIVTALDVAAAAVSDVAEAAGQAAATEVVTVSADESLEIAARKLVEHGLSHLIVIDPASGRPSGVLSALDIAAAYGG